MSTSNQEQIKKNREYIKCLIDIFVFLGRQGLAYRGHREYESSLNKGTYLFFITPFSLEFLHRFYKIIFN